MNPILRTLFLDWQTRELPIPLQRDITLDTHISPHLSQATLITGFRRVGKTYLLFQTIQKLLQTTPKDQILYLNFEDERLLSPTTALLTDLIPSFHAVFGHKPTYIFLDELQLVPHWSKWVRRVLDSEPGIKLFITGSSSKMSSAELPTELRGRGFEIKVLPLTFKEFLSFKNTPLIPYDKLSTDQQSNYQFLFEEYLVYGGLPAVVLSDKSQKIDLIQSYFQTVVQKDIGERYNLKNDLALKTLLKYLVNSKEFTISKLHHNLKSQSIAVGKSTVDTYLGYIENSYFFHPLYIHSKSVGNILLHPRKSYLVDTGFITALSPNRSLDYGRLLENLIFTQLSRTYDHLAYYDNPQGYEIDFVAKKDQMQDCYQVCYDLSDLDTLKREMRPLRPKTNNLNAQNNYLVYQSHSSLQIPPFVIPISALEFCLR